MIGLKAIEQLELLTLDYGGHAVHIEPVLCNLVQDSKELWLDLLQLLSGDAVERELDLGTDALRGVKIDGFFWR